jgi:hypothetical protein
MAQESLMNDVEKLVAAILAAALSSKGDTRPSAKDYVDNYESVLDVINERERSREKEKRTAAAKDDSWTAVNEELKRKKTAIADPA